MSESEINLLIISQNVFSYDLSLPKDAILRINLATYYHLKKLKNKIILNAFMFTNSTVGFVST